MVLKAGKAEDTFRATIIVHLTGTKIEIFQMDECKCNNYSTYNF